MSQRKYYPTVFALYMMYFILGIAVTITCQYKQEFAYMWNLGTLPDGILDVSGVMAVIAAAGLGRLLALPVAGPFSDRYGRRSSALVGAGLFLVFFLGMPFAPNQQVAYVLTMFEGMANSFTDTSVTPSCMEIFGKNGVVANLFTKFSVSLSQLLLPFMILGFTALEISFRMLYLTGAALILLDGILLIFLPFPEGTKTEAKQDRKKDRIHLNPSMVALIGIGFTSTATFQLYLNCNQELGVLYGLQHPQMTQVFYSIGTVCAVICTSILIKKGLRPVRVLLFYPVFSVVTLLLVYFIRVPISCLLGGFGIGYFAGGGVLQLAVSAANAMYPEQKGKMTSIIMIASSLADYVILNVAGALSGMFGTNGPAAVLIFNMLITCAGILIAAFLNVQYEKGTAL